MAFKNKTYSLGFCIILILLSFNLATGQRHIPATDFFEIKGDIKQNTIVSLKDLSNFNSVLIDSVVITNHLQQRLHSVRHIKAVLFKDILENIKLNVDSPKELNKYYLKFIASDGYIILFSWNEIFNSPTGNNTYLIVEKEGKPLRLQKDKISMIVTTDFATGRRYLKGLKYIIISKLMIVKRELNYIK